ncbi:hypothetical protein QFC21_004326 [Naganishia friedmannii]|uniref:Uncharacterized protein n=1 Tax=Naganishia friedmannii TaxID=89922 RepID=A0ACC2VH25_9TREE|nr:hypothetical protein QFC21_004326 [Naganishia friedmannii]
MNQPSQEQPVPDVEAEVQSLLAQIAIESRIQYGAQKFLESLSQDDSFVPEQDRDGLRRKTESELAATEDKIEAFKRRIRELGPLRPRTFSSATTNTTASHDRIIHTEPDQMSIISSSEGGAYPTSHPPGFVLTTSPRSQMRQSTQNRTLLRQIEMQSRSRSRQNSSRGDVRPHLSAQQFSVTSVGYSLEHMDALSRLANAVAATGLGNRDSFSLDRSGPFDLYSPTVGKNGEMDALLDNINTLAEQEERRRAEIVEALTVARKVLKGLETQQDIPLTSGMPSRYGLSQRRPTEARNEGDPGNDDTPNAARRYASFMRDEAHSQSSSSDTGGPHNQGMKGSPAKMIALLTRCLKMCPDILLELEFEKLIDASLARQPQTRQNEEAEQAILLIRTAMHLPVPMPSDDSEETHDIVDRSFDSHSEADVQEIDLLPEYTALKAHEHLEEGKFQEEGIESDKPTSVLAQGLIRALVGMAENPEDGLQRICLETVAELAILDLHAVTEADAFRVLLQAVEQGPYDTSRAITSVLIHVLDSPLTRNALPVHTGIEVLLSGFTDAYGKGAAYLERLTSTAENVLTMLRSWGGLMYCYTYKERGVAALVEALKIPVTEMREVLIDMLFAVFRINTPQWYQAFLGGKRLSMGPRVHQYQTSGANKPNPTGSDKSNLVDQYTALLLAIFIDAGLVEALINLVEEEASLLTRKATLLIGEVLILASRVLPYKMSARVQVLPRLFEMAAAYDNPAERTAALTALASINSFHRARRKLEPQVKVTQGRKRADSVIDSLERGHRQLEKERIRVSMQMDDRQFQGALVDSQVMYTKDPTKWNYDILMDVIEGPLLNPKRFEEAFMVSKFGRRLLSFFHPLSRQFSDMKATETNTKWIRLGTTLVTTLLATESGFRYLREDRLFKQLIDCFTELDQYAGQPSAQPFLTRSRMESTLSVGYFDMLGVLSKHDTGTKLLVDFRFFTRFYHLSELNSRDDLIRAMIAHFDYSADGHPRIVLSKALTSNYMHTRLYATEHLGKIIAELGPETWALELLVTQLYDTSPQVSEVAARNLETVCENLDTLQVVVNMRPILDHLGDVGQALLMRQVTDRFLSTSIGFSYLLEADYIDREMDEWFYERNLQYVVQIELYLDSIFGPSSQENRSLDQVFRTQNSPPHFYGEITKTEGGCSLLREKGHFYEFARFIEEHAEESFDQEILLKLKSVLWAVGNIGVTEGGLAFLEETGVVEDIVDIAEKSEILSLRGTGFFVLGLISTTVSGADLLEDFGWVPTTTVLGLTTGLCIPEKIDAFAKASNQVVSLNVKF